MRGARIGVIERARYARVSHDESLIRDLASYDYRANNIRHLIAPDISPVPAHIATKFFALPPDSKAFWFRLAAAVMADASFPETLENILQAILIFAFAYSAASVSLLDWVILSIKRLGNVGGVSK